MKILSPAFSTLARLRYSQIEDWIQDPIATQRKVLQDLVTHAQYTSIGRKYGLTRLFSMSAFKKSIPIHEYDDI
ncbi:MAG: GH3 auxin-responsive promoter family protein, partial [Sediminibacterium sp.]|nr:GH3 auxin-responsive promoter family protein [Sediminibacterium sp.]